VLTFIYINNNLKDSKKNKMSTLNIEKQIRETARKAWRDVIEEKLTQEQPDFEYVVTLYTEFKKKVLELVLNEKLKKLIDEDLDVVLFKQMIVSDSFNVNDFFNLVEYCFVICKKLGSAARDNDTDELKKEVYIEFGSDVFKGISLFFLNLNICIDWIYEDILKITKDIRGEK